MLGKNSVTEPTATTKTTVRIDPDLVGSCDELDLSKASVSDHVQTQWADLTTSIEASAFSIEQLQKARDAVAKMIDVTAAQKKAKNGL